MNASVIKELLAVRHKNDIFVSECKDGPTHTANHLRMDAWAMKRSWTNRISYGYEIKINRQDFLRDEKWHNYLGYCNEFYFVCPSKLISPDEIPAEVGLLYTASTGTRLYTKKKAARRNITIPEKLYLYILICRAKINGADIDTDLDVTKKYFQSYVKDKDENRELGYMVSAKIRQKVSATMQENAELKHRIEIFDDLTKRLDEIGIDMTKPLRSWDVHKKIDDLLGEIPPSLSRDLSRMVSDLTAIKQIVDGS